MYRLSSIIFVLFVGTQLFAQSPHGNELKTDCAQCHTSENWLINLETLTFNHNEITEFKLEGTHLEIDCKECHSTLVFNEAQNDCMSCHTDIHTASVGNDCVRCHSPKSWTVDNIPELHEENGFPLTGPHTGVDCQKCHISETNLRFDRIGNECIICHKSTFENAKNPDHVAGNFSTSCTDCHSSFIQEWTPINIQHDFFPLTLGHEIYDCKKCHINNNFEEISTDCVSCHKTTFDNTTNPNHVTAGFNTDCISCHTTNLGWSPTTFDHAIFPLTQGHDLPDCKQCHTTANFSDQVADCVSCHQITFDSTTSPNHVTAGFPTDCVACHTTNRGWTPSTFNHDFFPLTQGHDLPDCKQCHTTANFSDQVADCVS
ncbi:MAG: cytochrome c3 family protein, partial [Lutibacter sp.]|nr:cytochrome c3 family protein [Lutibacter sp.]